MSKSEEARTTEGTLSLMAKEWDPREHRKAANSMAVLSEFITALRGETEDEINDGIRHYYCVDFQMVYALMHADERYEGKLVGAALCLAEKNDALKAVLTEGTKQEMERYLKHSIREISKSGRLVATNARRASKEGVFRDKSWRTVERYIDRLGIYDKRFMILDRVLSDCCLPFTQMGVGDESHFLSPDVTKSYEERLVDWSRASPAHRERSPQANTVDARVLSILSKLSAASTLKVDLRLVTSTSAIHAVAEGSVAERIVNPLYFYMSQKIRHEYPDPVERLDFVLTCSIDILELQRGLNMVIHGDRMHMRIYEGQIEKLLDKWKLLFTDGTLADLKRWLGRAVQYSIDSWITEKRHVQEGIDFRVPWVLVEHVVGKARRILNQLMGGGAGLLELLGACWKDTETFPDGTRDRLCFEHSFSEVVFEAFDKYYSVYWDADRKLSSRMRQFLFKIKL